MAVTYEPIATYTAASAQSTITFSSISGTYTDLVLVCNIKDTNGYTRLRVNNDSTSIYSRTYMYGNGTTAESGRQTGETSWFSSGNSANFEPAIHNFMNYSNTTTFKTMMIRSGMASTNANTGVYLWRSTSAINRIDIISVSGTATIETGSVITLYGIKAA